MNKQQILKEIISSRKSIFPKDYSKEPIPDDVLAEILQSAEFAPNHKRTRPWLLKVFRGDEKMKLGNRIAEIYREMTPPEKFLEKKFVDISAKVNKSDTVLAVCVNFSDLVPEWEEIAATAMAVQNMYLTCTAYNIGCYWSTPALKDHLNVFLGLQESQKCFGFFYLGNTEQSSLK